MSRSAPPTNESLRSFTYRAVAPNGSKEGGVIRATSRPTALAQLIDRGLHPFEVVESTGPFASGHGRLSASDLAVGLRQLATLLDAGLPLHRVLTVFGELAPTSWRAAIPAARTAVANGQGLSAALGTSLRIPEVVLGMLRAGEATGRMAPAVHTAAEFSERTSARANAIRAALAYPLLLCVVGGAAVAILVAVVIPRFAVILADLGQSLPPTTRIVLAIARGIQGHIILITAGIVGISLFITASRSTAHGREWWDAWLIQLPLIGAIRWSSAAGRFCTALSSLLDSGLPITPAVLHASRAAGDSVVAGRVMEAREKIIAGQRIGVSLRESNALPTTATRLIEAGDESGQLSVMLRHAGVIESDNAHRLLTQAVRLLEPTLILMFAGLVTLVAAALLQAIYSIRPSV